MSHFDVENSKDVMESVAVALSTNLDKVINLSLRLVEFEQY